MELKETIKLIIKRFQESPPIKVTKRNVELPVHLKKIVSVIGVRRCGKTYLLYDTINRLLEMAIPIENIMYINFEDERLQLTVNDLDLILQAWRELHNGITPESQWFFFDEIQNVEGWEKFIRRIYDTETQNIFITGSNSAFLAKEIATALRGRTLQYEVFPFSFQEYLWHLNINTDYYSEQNRALIINKFNSYLYEGGFPETVDLLYREQAELLRTYFYVMLYKDLIERYKISSVTVLKFFIGKLADNLTKPFSLNKIYNELHSQGFKLDKNSLYELIEYFENIYLSFKILKFDNSFASRSRADKKAYFIDNGLVNILTNRFSEDKGKLLENAVFLFLRNKYGDLFNDTIFYYKNGKECDFVVFDRDKPSYCIQVCYDISQSATKEREIAGLLSALKYFNMETGYIITAEQEENLFIENKQIFIKPAYKIMIDNEIKK